MVPMDNPARCARRSTQQTVRQVKIAAADGPPHGATAHGNAVNFYRSDHFNSETALRAQVTQRVGATHAVVTKADAVTHHHGVDA
jgi:hypothetical protein